MALVTDLSRIKLKTNSSVGFTPAIGPSADHTDGSWALTDIYEGECVIDIDQDVMYFGGDGAVFELLNKDANDNFILTTSSSATGDRSIVGGLTNVDSGGDNIIAGQNQTMNGSSSILTGSGNLVNINCAYNILGGQSHIITLSSRNVIGGSSITATSSNQNVIGGSSQTVTDSDKNGVFGSSHTLLAGSDVNIVGGAGNILTTSSYNGVSGNSHTLTTSSYNGVFGNNNTLTDSYSNGVSGAGNIMTDSGGNVVGGGNNIMTDSNSGIFTGDNHTINESQYCGIIGGTDCILDASPGSPVATITNAVIIACDTLTASQDDSVYVPNIILTNQADASTVVGTIRYDGTNFQGYNGSWVDLDDQNTYSGPAGASGDIQINDGAGNLGVGTTMNWDGSGLQVTQIGTNQITDFQSAGNEKIALSTSVLNFYSSHATNPVISLTSAGVVINEGSNSAFDFRVESDAQTKALFLDSGANTIEFNVPIIQGTSSIATGTKTLRDVGFESLEPGGALTTIYTLPIPDDSGGLLKVDFYFYLDGLAGGATLGDYRMTTEWWSITNINGTLSLTSKETIVAEGGTYGPGITTGFTISGTNVLIQLANDGATGEYGTGSVNIEYFRNDSSY